MLNVLRNHGALFSLEENYPDEYDLVDVRIRDIIRHAAVVRRDLTALMRRRFPINMYEVQLMQVRKRPSSHRALEELWKVYYSVPDRVLVYRIPYFLSAFARREIASIKGRFNIKYWSMSKEPRGLLGNSNYWTDNVVIIHKELVALFDLPMGEVNITDLHKSILELGVLSLVKEVYLVDHPDLCATAPLLEVTTSDGDVFFYDSRYVDLLRARWLYPGVLVNWVNDVPYLVFKRGRIIPLTGGHIVLAIAPVELTEDGVEIWKSLRGPDVALLE